MAAFPAQLPIEHVIARTYEVADIGQSLGEFIVPNRRVHSLAQLAVRHVCIEQHTASLGQSRSSLVKVLQRAQPRLTVGLLGPAELKSIIQGVS